MAGERRIKNIIFDMGRVLVEYDPMKVCTHFMDNEEEQKQVLEEVFHSSEWVELDRGTITEEEAMITIQNRLPQGHVRESAQQCMDHWDEYNIWPKEGMEAVVKNMKGQGYNIYLLSNASLRLRRYQHVIPGIDLFDGTIVSAEELCIKPEPEIYERLFTKYQLKPGECFFVDDLQVNIDGARKCGMEGYCFADGNVEKLKKVLEEL